tara:strand:+ start:339 stop:620 length:282 start_codon:yes stop_codon:yes gene_type:complete
MTWPPANTEKVRAWILLARAVVGRLDHHIAMEDLDDAFMLEGAETIERLLDFVPAPPKKPWCCPGCGIELRELGEALICKNPECSKTCYGRPE